MEQGNPVQVVTLKDGGCFELNEVALRQVLLQDDVKDLPVVVVSVAGKMRQGKSFLLNLIIRYLKNKETDASARWLGDEAVPLSGFEFRPGPQYCTSGILIWSEVFILTGPEGEKVAVLLMDTQGTFDNSTTMKECSTLFALSTMVSSIQLYNVMMDIKRDDIESLQLFAEYGRATQAQGHATKPFKSLHILVRDWQWADSHPFGAEGGSEFLHTKLGEDNGVSLCFEHVSCFLLPYPWSKVAVGGRMDGDVRELDGNFKEILRQYLDIMFAWDNLYPMVKTISTEEEVTVKDILSHLKVYVTVFQNNAVPVPQSALEANAHVTLTKAYEMGLKSFEDIKKSLVGSIIDERTPVHDPALLQATLNECWEHALRRFKSRVTLGADENLAGQYYERLRQDMERIILSIVQLNNVKMQNEEAQKAVILAEAQKKEAEIKKEKAKKVIRELQKQKHEAERRRKLAERGRKKAEVGLLEAESLAEERLQEAERELKEAVRELTECDAARQKAEDRLKGFGNRANLIGAVRVLGGVLLTAASFVNPVAAVVSTVVKPIFDVVFPPFVPTAPPPAQRHTSGAATSWQRLSTAAATEPTTHERSPKFRASSSHVTRPRKRKTYARDFNDDSLTDSD